MELYQQFQQCLTQNSLEQARQYLVRHLQANPRHALGFYQLGRLNYDLGQWSAALCDFLEACRLEPDNAEFHRSAGVAYHDLQQPYQAIHEFEVAFEKSGDPLARYNRAMSLLMAGRYEEGLRDYELRFQISPLNERFKWHPPEKLWRGQPFPNQTLVVYTEQGQGDNIQFCRYFPYVKAMGGRVVYATWPDLTPIMSTLPSVDLVVEHGAAAYEKISFDWAVPIMSLPGIFGTTLDSIPNQTPYLSIPPLYRAKWQGLLAPLEKPGVKRIGIVYGCSPTNLVHRTCPFPLWESLLARQGVQWFSIQKGAVAEAAKQFANHRPDFFDLTGEIGDYGDTAALIERLDLVISVDTSVAHLAGALGKPVWLLLPFAADWRWLRFRSDSPWYPGFRLYRQPLPGQWQPVLRQLTNALDGWLRTNESTRCC